MKASAKSYKENMKRIKDSQKVEAAKSNVPSWSKPQFNELLTWVAKDPVIRSSSIIAVVDESYKRLIAIDKTALPAGTDIDKTN